jgi:hypothetical protein
VVAETEQMNGDNVKNVRRETGICLRNREKVKGGGGWIAKEK